MRSRFQDSHVRIHPRVRYVDDQQAIVEIHIQSSTPIAGPDEMARALEPQDVQLHIEMHNAAGFHDEYVMALQLENGTADARFDIVQPHRWWPAGMGKQELYEMTLSLRMDDRILDQHQSTIGFTSVRTAIGDQAGALMVNGVVCEIQQVVAVDQIDEKRMLPVGGDSLLVVRGHFGTDVLYEAADRAGMLLIQCIPLHPRGFNDNELMPEIHRLAGHPSLAGWYVGHLGSMCEDVASRIHEHDPTRSIFHTVPGYPDSRMLPGVSDYY